jgi:hypothetical protein
MPRGPRSGWSAPMPRARCPEQAEAAALGLSPRYAGLQWRGRNRGIRPTLGCCGGVNGPLGVPRGTRASPNRSETISSVARRSQAEAGQCPNAGQRLTGKATPDAGKDGADVVERHYRVALLASEAQGQHDAAGAAASRQATRIARHEDPTGP